MKKIFMLILSVLFCFPIFGCVDNSTNNMTDTDTTDNKIEVPESNTTEKDTPNNKTEVSESDEEKVISMFLNYTERDSDGNYRFLKHTTNGNVSFLYNFSYSPYYNLFNANLLVTRYTSITMYDYAAVTFNWGNFKKGLFYAYHELESVAKIEFEYNGMTFTNNNIGTQYFYLIQSNTFSNLNEKSDIDSYAATGYEVLQQAINYMNSVIRNHNLSISL